MRHPWSLLLLIFCLSLPVKFIAAHNMVWDMDIVPVMARGQAWLAGGDFPAYGTLSSVAAYNMPFLVWLHLPALIITDDVRGAMLITLLVFNAIGTLYCYLAGAALFQPRVGIIAAALFTFSETSVSSSYTAWAQLLLPVFFIAVFYHLWQWRIRAQGRHLALAGIIATAGFMTHFAAIMLFPAMLVFALLTRARWQWRGLLAGGLVCGVMLTPYLLVQAERDFVDLQAFLTRKSPIPADVLAQYEHTIGQNQPVAPENTVTITPIPSNPTSLSDAPPTTPPPENVPAAPTLPERIGAFALSLPGQYWDALRQFNIVQTAALNQALPGIGTFTDGLATFMIGMFFVVGGGASLRLGWEIRQSPKVTPILVRTSYRNQRSRHVTRAHIARPHDRRQPPPANDGIIVTTPSGRLVLLLVFIITFSTGLILLRAAPTEQGSYYTGLVSLQWVIVAYGMAWLASLKFATDDEEIHPTNLMLHEQHRAAKAQTQSREKNNSILALLVGLILTVYLWGLGADRILRITQHHDTVYTRYNVWLYRHIDAVTKFIADDWQAPNAPIIQYDVLPEMANLWWVIPWHSVDPLYRIGAPYDYLLQTQYGIHNANQQADGLAEAPDYIVVYPPGLARYPLDAYTLQTFGAIYVLKPRQP